MIVHPVKHLTSNYEKDEDSNNYKLLSLGHKEHLEILVNLNKIEAYRDMDNATGYTLDKIGKNVLELRRSRDDEAYRPAIKIKIIGNLSAGTIEELNQIAEILFGVDFISIQETWDKGLYDNEPAALFMSQRDNPDMQRTYFEYIKELITVVKAGGVRLYNRIYTEIPEATVYIGAAESSDSSGMFIPPKILADMKIQEAEIQVGAAMSVDYYGMAIPPRVLANVKTPAAEIQVGAAMSVDSSCMFIQPCLLEDMTVSSIINCASVNDCDIGYMRIPTAALKEG